MPLAARNTAPPGPGCVQSTTLVASEVDKAAGPGPAGPVRHHGEGMAKTLLPASERKGQPTDSALAWALVLGRYCDHGVAVSRSVEVGVDFPQSREFKPCAQFTDREGTERDHVFVRLNLAAVVEGEHQMGDVLVAEAIRYLPGIEHQASPPPASHHPICH